MEEGCVFCQIIEGTLPASIVYEDDLVLAFMDLNPVNTGHMLVIPKVHAPYLKDLDNETAGHMMKIAHKLAGALRDTDIPCEGVNLFLADGEAAMQEVFHAHLHIIPRFDGDGFGLKHGSKNFVTRNRQELDEVAEKIKSTCLPS